MTTTVALALAAIAYLRFLVLNDQRPGVVLADPVLALVPAYDVTWIVFGILYASMALALFALGSDPFRLVLAMASYALMMVVRIIAMYVVPFDPPPGMIPLVDPVAIFLGGGVSLSRDLFFSGHTATLCILSLTARSRAVRLLFLAAAVVVGISVIVQHVHYTVDVLAAPFFAYGCYRLAVVWFGDGGSSRA